MQSIYDVDEADFFMNPPRWCGYSVAVEPLIISNTDPSVLVSWMSPSIEVISESGDLAKWFDYTTNPGSVTYLGPFPIVVKCESNVSANHSENNSILRFKWSKNNTPNVDSERYITDKVTNARTEAVLPCSNIKKLEYGDYLDFFFGSDTLGTVYIDKAEYNITTIAILK